MNQTNSTTLSGTPVPASYKITISQPDGRSRFIHMDTDVYNPGEVVEFYISGEKSETLTCLNNPPTFSVKFQTGIGSWATRVGTDTPNETTNKTYLGAGQATQVYRFVSTGWEPNRYRIESDCGVSREFLLRSAPTPVPILCPQNDNEPLWVHINPLNNHYAGINFSISGTTNQAAGGELRYLVFPSGMLPKNLAAGNERPLTTLVSEGTCGENTWSVDLNIPAPQEYYLMISAGSLNSTAIQRFRVL